MRDQKWERDSRHVVCKRKHTRILPHFVFFWLVAHVTQDWQDVLQTMISFWAIFVQPTSNIMPDLLITWSVSVLAFCICNLIMRHKIALLAERLNTQALPMVLFFVRWSKNLKKNYSMILKKQLTGIKQWYFSL